MSALRRLARTCARTAVLVGASAVLAGLAESAVAGIHGLSALAATGFAALLSVPLGLPVALLLTGLYRAWRPEELLARLTESHGGTPRLLAWALLLLTSLLVFTFAGFHLLLAIAKHTATPVVVALGGVLGLAALATLLLLLAGPALRILTGLARRLERARSRAGVPRPVRAPQVVLLMLALGALIATGAWQLAVAPLLGQFRIDFLLYPALFVLTMGAGAWLAPRLRDRTRRACAAAVALLVLCSAAAALLVHVDRRAAMLAIWSAAPVAGRAVDLTHDMRALRRQIRFDEVRPVIRGPLRDVVLVTVDTLRADRLEPWGGAAPTPALSALARRSTVFRWAFAPSNVTRRSLPSLLTGLHATRVAGRMIGWALRLDPRHTVLAEWFAAAGYRTAGFFCCPSFFAPEVGLGWTLGLQTVDASSDEEAIERAVNWLRQRATGSQPPVFLWIHLIAPHNWPERFPAREFGPDMAGRYDRTLAEHDRTLADLLAELNQPGRRPAVLVLTSDHGEGLGDHGVDKHSATLYNSELRVPLLIAAPGVAPRHVVEPVGLVDLFPTILELAGLAPPGPDLVDGKSLVPLLRGERRADPAGATVFAYMIADRSSLYDIEAVVRGPLKLIRGRHRAGIELYDYQRDPAESNNLAPGAPGLVRELGALLDAQRLRNRRTAFPRR
jgi:hypothetical protein